MAKQSTKAIEARKAQLSEAGFIENELGYIKNGVIVETNAIEQEVKKTWEETLAAAVADADNIIEAEVIKDETEKGLTLQSQIEADIARLDINVVKINEVADIYKDLVIVDFNDKDGYEKVKAAKKVVRSMRTMTENKRKAVVADILARQKGVNAKASEYETLIVKIESPIDKMLDQWEEWEKEEEKKIEEEANRVLNERVTLITGAGCLFTGSFYTLGDGISMDIVSLKAMKESDFNFLLEKIKLEKIRLDKIEAEKAEEKRKADEAETERQRLLKVKEDELETQRQQQQDKEKELEDERQSMRRERLVMREGMAHNAGLTFNPNTLAYEFTNKYYQIAVTKTDMENMDGVVYGDLIKDLAGKITIAKSNADTEAKKEEERRRILNDRHIEITDMGLRKKGNIYTLPDSEISISVEVLENSNNEFWSKTILETTDAIDAHKKEKDRLANRYNDRCTALTELGMTGGGGVFAVRGKYGKDVTFSVAEIHSVNDDNWPVIFEGITEQIAEMNREIQEEDKRIEGERKAAIPEVKRLATYITVIEMVEVPELKTAVLKDIQDGFNHELAELIEKTRNQIEALGL